MEIKQVMRLESGEKEKLTKLLEGLAVGKEKPESIVEYVTELITGAFIIGGGKGEK